MKEKIKYSVILPVYNEEKSINELISRLVKILNSIRGNWEIILIDDGSSDNSFAEIRKQALKDSRIKGIRLRKNSGKSMVYSCGFFFSSGEIIFTLDSDLQDQPEEIPKFIAKLNAGYDVVCGWKIKRRDPILFVMASKIFNFVAPFLTGLKIHDFNCGFRAFRKEATADLNLYGDLYRFIPALVAWKGFKVGEVKIRHMPRRYGKSKYGFSKFTRGFFDLFTIIFLLKFLRRPLHLFGLFGVFCLIIGFLINFYLTILWFSGEVIGRRPLLILGVLLIIIGLQFVSTGLLAEMIAYFQAKNERDYPIAQKLGRF